MNVHAVLASGRDERLRPPALVVASLSAVTAFVFVLAQGSRTLVVATVLGAGIVTAELLVLRWPPAGEIPLSYAVFLVVARGMGLQYAVATVIVAEAVTLIGDERVARSVWRAGRSVAVGVAAIIAYHVAFAAMGHHELVEIVVAALLVGATVEAAIDGSMHRTEHEVLQTFWPERALYSWGAVVGTGVVMAVAIRGVDGDGALGVRGAALLALPLLAVWWSFQQEDASARMLRQTIDALAMVPALTGAVEVGVSARDAETVRRVGRVVGLTPDQEHTVAIAARLRHIGAAATEPTIDLTVTRPVGPVPGHVERATAQMLRDTPFADAGEVVRVAGHPPRHGASDDAHLAMSATVLRVVGEFQAARDNGRDAATAIGALRARHADRRATVVVDAIERLAGAGELD